MTKRQEALLVYERISVIIFVAASGLNFFLPVFEGRILNFNIFTLLMAGFYLYAVLGAKGFFKKVESKEPDGRVIYTAPVPIMQIGLLRIFEVLFYAVFHLHEVRWFSIIACIFVDCIFIAVRLADKGNYYFESIGEDDDDQT